MRDDHVELRICDRLATVSPDDWDALIGDGNPFVCHAFLQGLEEHDCLHLHGWQPRHFLLYRRGHLVAAMPAYLKNNSYGEFVFDHAWAEYYQSQIGNYYPKLVSAVPYSPIAGPRLLTTQDHNGQWRRQLVNAALRYCQQWQLSGFHLLFCNRRDMQLLTEMGFLSRRDYQYHWRNEDYHDWAHFLSFLKAKKRKNVRQERQRVAAADIEIEACNGAQMSAQQWHLMHRFYASIYHRKFGVPALTAEFFCHLGRHLGNRAQVFFAHHKGQPVAGALLLRGKDRLYGRYWGCREAFDSLHFELCYYRGIDYCIQHKLSVFEPGAQGEHKISRGFLPTSTWSAHRLVHAGFSTLLRLHLQREDALITNYGEQLKARSPFRQ